MPRIFHRLLSPALLVTGLTICASLVNYVAQGALAYRFGAGQAVDGYLFALSVPTFLAGSLSAIISYTVVPMLSEHHGDDLFDALASSIFIFVCGIASLVMCLGVPAIILQTSLLPPQSHIGELDGISLTIMLAWVLAGFQIIGAVIVAQLNAVERPVLGAFMAFPTGLGTIIALLLSYQFGIWVAVAGAIIGALLGVVSGIAVLSGSLLPLRYDPEVQHKIIALSKTSIWAVLALSCFTVYALIDAYWAPRIASGALSALGYSQRVVIGLGGMVIAGPSALLVPKLARLIAAKNYTGFRMEFLRGLAFVAVVLGPCIGLLYFGAEALIGLLFKRGAFGNNEVALVVSTLRAMLPGMAAMIFSVLIFRALFCFKDSTMVTAALGLGWGVCYFLLCGLWLNKGAVGIAQAYSFSWVTIFFIATLYTLWKIQRLTRTVELR